MADSARKIKPAFYDMRKTTDSLDNLMKTSKSRFIVPLIVINFKINDLFDVFG